MGRTCHQCDAAIAHDAKFCDQCGAAVEPTTRRPSPSPSDEGGIAPVLSLPEDSAEQVANRRQMSIMSCDIVGSSFFMQRLDPEDWQYVLDRFHEISKREIEKYTGFYAQFLGDGFMSYFGYPYANEDNAHRAVLSGLCIIEGIGTLNAELEAKLGIALHVRVGVDTGQVLVDKLVVGEPPTIATRVQSLARPDTLVVTETTKRLLPPGGFEFRDLGMCEMKNVDPQRLYEVAEQTQAHAAPSQRTATPLIGRKQHLGLLLEGWERVVEGDGQAIIIAGEGGIGKSKLVDGLEAQIAGALHMSFCCHGSPFRTNTMLHPVIESIQRAAEIHAADAEEEKRAKLDRFFARMGSNEKGAALISRLLSISREDALPIMAPKILFQQTLDALIDIVICQARKGPILLVFEDVHWFDSTTMDLLKLLIPMVKGHSALLILTTRSTYTRELQEKFFLTQISLNRLRSDEALDLIHQVAGGKTLPESVKAQILGRANGVPLYVEELTKMVLEADASSAGATEYPAFAEPDGAIPLTLRDPLTARVDRVKGRDTLQLAATLGRTFPYELLLAISTVEPRRLDEDLRELVSAELLYQRGRSPNETVFEFKHALIRDAAYSLLTKSDREKTHRRIGHALEDRFPDIARTHPEIVAHHYTEARASEKALAYWTAAGLQSAARSAHSDAIEHFKNGLDQLSAIQDSAGRRKSEQVLQTALGHSLRAIRGWSVDSVKDAYARALHLGEQGGLDEQSVPALFGLWTWNFVHSSLDEAKVLADRLFEIARRAERPVYGVLAHQAQGFTMFGRGQFEEAHATLEHGILMCSNEDVPAFFDLSGQDPRIHVRIYDAIVLWFLGYPDRALKRCTEAQELGQQSLNPFSRALALTISLRIHQFRGDVVRVSQQADAAVAYAEEHGFAHYLAMATVLRGWARAQKGDVERGIAEIWDGFEKERSTGAQIYESYVMGLLAEICIKSGDFQQASDILANATARLTEGRSERFYEAEIHRLSGELSWRMQGDPVAARRHIERSLEIARKQKARSLELRSCISLLDLHVANDEGANGEAVRSAAALEKVYAAFDEGFDTADLLRAKKRLAARREFTV